MVNGKLITGVSGGEFGVVGKIEAYNAKNGELLWTRPTVEGHMGYVWKDGKKVEAGISGGEAGKTAGRPVEDRRRGALAGRLLRSGHRLAAVRHRQPGAVELAPASRRQPVFLLAPGAGPERRLDQVALPVHAA